MYRSNEQRDVHDRFMRNICKLVYGKDAGVAKQGIRQPSATERFATAPPKDVKKIRNFALVSFDHQYVFVFSRTLQTRNVCEKS